MSETRVLTGMMDNLDAWRLGEIARKAGDVNRKDVGDPIDRGLVLLKMLNQMGYTVTVQINPRDDLPAVGTIED